MSIQRTEFRLTPQQIEEIQKTTDVLEAINSISCSQLSPRIRTVCSNPKCRKIIQIKRALYCSIECLEKGSK